MTALHRHALICHPLASAFGLPDDQWHVYLTKT